MRNRRRDPNRDVFMSLRRNGYRFLKFFCDVVETIIMNHAELENLDYASAGHTGFAAEVDVPVEYGSGVASLKSKNATGAGTITLTNGSDALVGTGTQFVGDEGATTLTWWQTILVDGVIYQIDSITNDTNAVLVDTWTGDTQTIPLVFSGTAASGDSSIAFGEEARATGYRSIAIGYRNKSVNSGTLAIGRSNEITADQSTAIGDGNIISSSGGVAIGNGCQISESTVITIGNGLLGKVVGEFAIGAYNVDYTPANDVTDPVFRVGNGADAGSRSDALILRKNGNLDLFGTLQANGLRIEQSPTAETITCDSTIIISIGGVDYKIPCVAA